MKNRGKLLGYICALFTVVVWGATFISTKVLLRYYTPTQIMLIRFILAEGFLWLLRPRRLRLQKGEEVLFLLMGLFSSSLYALAENTALMTTQAANVSILVATAPIFTALMAHFTTDEKFHSGTVIGLLVAFAGAVLVVFNGAFLLKLNPKGDLLSVLAAVFWSFYSVLMKRFTGRYDSLLISRRILFWGMVTAVPMVLLEGAPLPLEPLLLPEVILNYLFLGLLGSAVCYVCWNEAFTQLGVVATNSFLYAVPFITILAAAFFLGEPISPVAVAGAVLITLGVAAAERQPKKPGTPSQS